VLAFLSRLVRRLPVYVLFPSFDENLFGTGPSQSYATNLRSVSSVKSGPHIPHGDGEAHCLGGGGYRGHLPSETTSLRKRAGFNNRFARCLPFGGRSVLA
jgi:hypothetical protein